MVVTNRLSDQGLPLAEIIATARREAGLTQEEFAEIIDRSQRWVSNVETGVIKSIRPSLLRLVADTLHLRPEDILIATHRELSSTGASELLSELGAAGALHHQLESVIPYIGKLSMPNQRKLAEYVDDLTKAEAWEEYIRLQRERAS